MNRQAVEALSTLQPLADTIKAFEPANVIYVQAQLVENYMGFVMIEFSLLNLSKL